MINELDDKGWEVLLKRIQSGKCTPFLGAGVNDRILPLGFQIAKEWAMGNDYPLDDTSDLVKVAQFLAIDRQDPMFPKEKILDLLKQRLTAWTNQVDTKEFFASQVEPLVVLASLPIPIYLTTNYDDLLVTALKAQGKQPQREFCPWNKFARRRLTSSIFDDARGFDPSDKNPVVYHLHGHDGFPESLVLTEDDYLDFLVNISRDEKMLPARVQEAFTGNSLIFVGYRLADWSFKVLFRGLVTTMDATLRRLSVSVQLPPDDVPPEKRQKVQEYLARYFGNIGGVQVFWGTASEFAVELRNRWTNFSNAG